MNKKGAPKKNKEDLRTDRFVYKLSKNQINAMGGRSIARAKLRVACKYCIESYTQ